MYYSNWLDTVLILWFNTDIWSFSKCLSGGVSTMFVITIERAVASRHFRSYEKSSSRLGRCLTIVEVRLLSISQRNVYLQLGIVVGLSYLVVYFYDFHLEYARCSVVTEKGQSFHMIQGVRMISKAENQKAVTIPDGLDNTPILFNGHILSTSYSE